MRCVCKVAHELERRADWDHSMFIDGTTACGWPSGRAQLSISSGWSHNSVANNQKWATDSRISGIRNLQAPAPARAVREMFGKSRDPRAGVVGHEYIMGNVTRMGFCGSLEFIDAGRARPYRRCRNVRCG